MKRSATYLGFLFLLFRGWLYDMARSTFIEPDDP